MQHVKTLEDVYQAIQTMIVRGALAIGVSAGYGMVLAANAFDGTGHGSFMDFRSRERIFKVFPSYCGELNVGRDRMVERAEALWRGQPFEAVKKGLEAEAVAIHEEDKQTNRNIGENLLSLLKDGDTVLTHCNAGSLATSGIRNRTVSVFYMAQRKGMNIKAFADETRPRLQGANLTAFELVEHGVDVTLICDNMAAVVLSQGKINALIVGCDRVAANGDTANKIGTFSVSVLANQFHVPVYIAAPTTTIDMEVQLEKRDPDRRAKQGRGPLHKRGIYPRRR